MMSVVTSPVVSPVDTKALSTLMAEPEATISGAPLFTPQAAGVLLLLALLSPKGPQEPERSE